MGVATPSDKATPARLEHVDMLRGLASCFVVTSHLRAFVFVNFPSLKNPTAITKMFYAFTGIGHSAVIIFFAMSGFLVGGKALADMMTDRWSWPRYLLRRSTRLLIVVAPALLATLILDSAGILATKGVGYDGSLYEFYSSGPSTAEPLSFSIWTFLGNMTFLQTIYVPIFGSNGPMWSLANEFWYYIVFPLAATIYFVPYSKLNKIYAIILLIILISLLPKNLLEDGFIWVAGAVASWLTRFPALRPVYRHIGTRAMALLLVLFVLAMTRNPFGHSDLVFGLCIASALPILAWLPSFGRYYQSAALAVAEVSYTLYLTHFPLFTLLVLVSLAPHRFQPGLDGAGAYGALMLAALAWAACFWWCFERNTDRVFRYLAKRFI